MARLWLLPWLAAAVALAEGELAARVAGAVRVGALFAVHDAPGGGGARCGSVREHYGIQRVEATLQALDAINADAGLLPGLRLGAELRDSCWAPRTALRQTLELVRDALAASQAYPQPPPRQLPLPAQQRGEARSPLLGVLGPGASAAAAQVQNLVQLFALPQLSYSATSRELSDKARFGTFFRVVPSDLHQARAVVALLRAHNWTYVSAVHTDESYGQSGMATFREAAAAGGVCVSRELALRAAPSDRETDAVVVRLREARSGVAVCWCEGRTVRALLAGLVRAAAASGPLPRLVATDGWADRWDVVRGREAAARGALTLRIRSPYLHTFDAYYHALRPNNNSRNPWFKEFWEHKFGCSLSPGGAFGVQQCTGAESLVTQYAQEPKLALVVRGVYALAHALHAMRAALCPPTPPPLCAAMLPFNLSLYQEFLARVRFRAPDGGLVAFDRNGDPPASLSEYDVMSFSRRGGRWKYRRIGHWRGGELRLRSERATTVRAAATRAACSPPCPPGHYQEAAGESMVRCCWACVPCPALAVPRDATRRNGSSRAPCRLCPPGSAPDAARTQCVASPVERRGGGGGSPWGAGAAAALAGAGLAVAAITAATFWRHRATPVVKSASRELSALLLLGAMSCHTGALAALAPPSPWACAASRLLPAPALAIMYAAVVARTLRVARLMTAAERVAPPPCLVSSPAQVWLCCALASPASLAAAWSAWTWGASPHVVHPTRARSVLECRGAREASAQLVPLAPALALLATGAMVAVRWRRLPHNYNETRFIGVAVYTTCVIWLAFFPIYRATEAKALTLATCVTLSGSATVTLLFGPRLYVLCARPERNTRAHFVTARSIRCHVGGYEPASAHAAHRSRSEGGGEFREVACQAASALVGPAAGNECVCVCWCAECGGCARITDSARADDERDIVIALLPHRHPCLLDHR